MKRRAVSFVSALALAGGWPARAAELPATSAAIDKQSVVFAFEARVDVASGVAPASKQVLAAVISTDFRSEPNVAKASQLLEKNAAAAARRIAEARRVVTWVLEVRQGLRMGTYDFDKAGFRTGVDPESRMLFYPINGAANITYGVRLFETENFTVVPVPLEAKDKFSALIEKQKGHLFCEVEAEVCSVQLENRLNRLSPGTPTKMLGLMVRKATLKFDDGTVIGTVSAAIPPSTSSQ